MGLRLWKKVKVKQRFVFLTEDFYKDYPHTSYPEIEQKDKRPYIQVLALIDGVQYAIPLRSNINHPHVLWTDKKNHCGVDFSKAVVITDKKYIDDSSKPYIRPNEFKELRGKDYKIEQKLRKYIKQYKEAKLNPSEKKNHTLIEKSTLQYFEEHIL